MKILAIESSCDETSVAITEERKILSNIVATQIAEHKIYGGVVPEIASRRHTESISQVCDEALKAAGITYSDVDAIAVTFAPGLIGALLVGVNFAKGLSTALGVPLIPVHHLRSHIAANYIDAPQLKPTFLCLTVSGGNTIITEGFLTPAALILIKLLLWQILKSILCPIRTPKTSLILVFQVLKLRL